MCGITGGWHPQPIAEAQITSALDVMRHRGPDDAGILQHDQAFIGMRRLSIIDIAGGHQPIYNEDGSIAVVFNGEIYNYIELIPDLEARGHDLKTKSDTEVLLHLYEEYGTDMCQFLRGMFCFAILDMRANKLFVARDRYGKKPVYYMRPQAGGLMFASEIKALRVLAAATGDSLPISEQGIYDYLSLGVPPQPSTIYENVCALPPGSWLTFDGITLDIQPYWRVDYTTNTVITYEEALEQTRALIAEAVRIRLRSDVPLGVLLSGGIDSTIVAYEAAKQVGDTLETFTVQVDDPTLNEAEVARQTAQTFGVKNTILPLEISPVDTLEALVRQYDQPFADPSAIPSLAIARLARQHVTVALNGDGGDELFAGYRRYVATAMASKFGWIPAPMAKVAADGLNALAPERRSTLGHAARFARTLAYDDGERYLVRTTDTLREEDKRGIWRGTSQRPTETWVEALETHASTDLGTQLSRDVQIILLSLLLVKMDIATMAASLEGRSPLMDHVVGEFAMSLPPHFLIHGNTPKALLRDAYRSYLPEAVISGKKRGFEIPLASWLQNELKPVVMDTLATSSAKVRRYVADDYVDRLVNGEIMQDRNWGYLVYSLLILELWLREFDSVH